MLCAPCRQRLPGQGLPWVLFQLERSKHNKKQMTIHNVLFMLSLWLGDVEGRGPVPFIQFHSVFLYPDALHLILGWRSEPLGMGPKGPE